MCLAVPGQIVEIHNVDPIFRTGKVAFGEITKQINLACVPEAGIGDYVLVHVGFAISRINEEEAQRVFEYLREIDELEELKDEDVADRDAPSESAAEPPVNRP